MKLSGTAKTYLALLVGSMLLYPYVAKGGNPFHPESAQLPPEPSAAVKAIVADHARTCGMGFSQVCVTLDDGLAAPYAASNPELYQVAHQTERDSNTGDTRPSLFITRSLSPLAKKFVVNGSDEREWDALGTEDFPYSRSTPDLALLALTDIHVTRIDYAQASHHTLAHVFWNAIPRYTNAYYALLANTPSSVDYKLRAIRYHAGQPTGTRMMTVSYVNNAWVYDPAQSGSLLFNSPEDYARSTSAGTILVVCAIIFMIVSLMFAGRALGKLLGAY